MGLFGDGTLPRVSRHRLGGVRGVGAAPRLAAFLITFMLVFGALVMSFVTGSEWGVAYGEWCVGFASRLSALLSAGLSRLPWAGADKVAGAIGRLMEGPVVATAVTAWCAALAVTITMGVATTLRSLLHALRGTDGSQAEVYGDAADGGAWH